MGAEGAADILYSKQMKDLSHDEKKAFRQEKIDEYNEKFMNPKVAVMNGYVDEVIRPEATRERIYADLLICAEKHSLEHVRKKHGCIPL